MKNNVSLIGRIGIINPRQFEDGSRVVNLSISVSDNYYTEQGELKERAYWIDATARNKVADLIVKHFKVGDQIAVTGKLIKRSYKHPNFDLEVFVTEVVIYEVFFEACRSTEKNIEEKQQKNNQQQNQ
ncbi:single-stranded DNA-binding protein [Myroides odoratimimus]|uniref:single-stranded DNA-binding protein n=1 Tax=Myroides odoratimimus TaxID=76832 RepID=UPI0025758164|nr:single-stranded DNA-binding protein [Myroides odoratimimus]MDM1398854.1 single-stranded DNA-binding protein [Myroides odoratimimus]